TRIRNTESELDTYSSGLNAFLDRIFDEHGLIVSGWSADWDGALRSAITRAPSRRYPLFWATRGEPSGFAADLISQRAGRVLTIASADALFERLQRDVETQATLMRPNPLSVDLLVASAKRYLAKPEHRIQLSDLAAEEARRARRLVAEGAFSVDTRVDTFEFARRVGAHEAIHEGLMRVLFTMGRWGLGDEFGLASEILKGLAQLPALGGSTFWLAMRSYPGVLALYAYGIGLVRADRIEELRRWLTTSLRNPYKSEPSTVVEQLFLWAWEASEDNTWRSLEGLERHKTPLSDHLLTVFSRWLSSEFPSGKDLEIAFETFETFGYLAHLGLSATTEDLRAAVEGNERRNALWAPVGRVGWNDENKTEVTSAVFGQDRRAKVAAAGFGRGDANYLVLAESNLKLLFGEFRWMR
ncbi:MAG: hypothetical protein ACJ798_17835, partial [Phenylobacterium sp.]